MIRWLRSLFAWRRIGDTGVWIYLENAVTGERAVRPSGAGGYQPVAHGWLEGRVVNLGDLDPDLGPPPFGGGSGGQSR